jgi:hypothetical protein
LKKNIPLAQILISVLLLSSFNSTPKKLIDDAPKYYVTLAWETVAFNTTGPLITNVTYVNCKFHSDKKVANDLVEYYNAYYLKERKTSSINRILSWRYDTYDQAEKKRRELLSGYKAKWDVLLIEKFTVLCDDK